MLLTMLASFVINTVQPFARNVQFGDGVIIDHIEDWIESIMRTPSHACARTCLCMHTPVPHVPYILVTYRCARLTSSTPHLLTTELLARAFATAVMVVWNKATNTYVMLGAGSCTAQVVRGASHS